MLQKLTSAIRHEKAITEIWIGNKEVKLCLLREDVIIQLENSKESMEKYNNQQENLDKITGYKMRI